MKKPRWVDLLDAPCDEEIFRDAVKAWNDALDVPLRDPNIPLKPGCLYLADIPINRAAMAAVKHLRGAGVENPQAYLWRLMHMGEIFRAAPALGFGELVREDEVHTAVLRAAAVARLATPAGDAIRSDEERPVFDLEDVAAKVRHFLEKEQVVG